MGLLLCGFFSINTYSTVNIFSYDSLNSIFFLIACFIVQIQYIIYLYIYKYIENTKCVLLEVYMIGKASLVNRIKLWGNQVYMDFQLHG